MSYFRLQANIISKKTQSAVASASYRSGEELYSERDEEMKSYQQREVAPVSFILKPDHAPEWTLEREKLWNEVEKIEKAWNAQLAREVLIALPVELPEDAQQELVQSFVQEEFVEEGMVADVAIHRDKEHNPHAHIMLTVRPFNEDGTWGQKKTRQYEFDQNGDILRDKKGEKVYQTVPSTDWNERETLVKWRMHYADAINESFQEHDIDQTVSALSFEAQGLDQIAEVRLERNEYQYVKRLEEKGIEAQTFYHQLNQEIREKNAEIAQLNDKIAFLSAKQKQTDVQTVLHRHTSEVTAQLNEDYEKSWHFMQGRLKDNFSFDSVHDQLQGLYRWEERKVEPRQVEAQITHAILNASHKAYQEHNFSVVKQQGFTSSDFRSLFTERLDAFEALTESVEKDQQTVDQVMAHAERTYRAQSLIVHNAFNELFPETNERFAHNDRTVAYKSNVLTAIQTNDLAAIPSAPEVNQHLQLQELKKACEQGEKASEQIRIQALIRNKLGSEKEQLVRDGTDPDAIYETSVKLNTTQQLIERYEAKAKHMDQELNALIRETFPQAKEKLLKDVEKLPLEMKTALLKHYTQQNKLTKVPTLKACLQVAKKDQSKQAMAHHAYQAKPEARFAESLGSQQKFLSHFPTGRASTELIEQLIEQAERDQHQAQHETPSPTKLRRKGKDKQLRRELGLEFEL